MMRSVARPYALIGWVAAVAGALGAIILRVVDPVPIIRDELGVGDVALAGFAFLGVAFASVGALLVARRPGNAVGWLMVLIGASNALAGLTAAMTFSAVADGPPSAAVAGVAAWLANLFAILGSLVVALGFIFPTGRGHTPAWDRFIRIGALLFVWLLVVFVLIRPGPLQIFASIDNPFGFGPDVRTVLGARTSALVVGSPALLVPLLGWSIVSRYRRADRIGRQQMKWFILALTVTLGGIGAAVAGAVAGEEPPEAGLVVFGFAGALIPVAIGIAILRYNLYDIDRLISRSIAYGIVSGILAIVFGGVVVVLSAALAAFAQGQTVAVAASTLAAFAIFQPVLRRVRVVVDRRFDRTRYDAERTVARFSDRLRAQLDLADLSADLDATIYEAIAPRSFGIWLRDDRA
jgi:hypothetical protein